MGGGSVRDCPDCDGSGEEKPKGEELADVPSLHELTTGISVFQPDVHSKVGDAKTVQELVNRLAELVDKAVPPLRWELRYSGRALARFVERDDAETTEGLVYGDGANNVYCLSSSDEIEIHDREAKEEK